MMSDPWLTVVMTTFNAQDFLETALDSILSQDDGRIEVVVVDDASSDGTLKILNEYHSRLNLTVIARPTNINNWMAGMNYGLRLARGNYVCLLQHDDFWLPGRLRAAQEAFKHAPDAVLLLHATLFVDREGRPLGTLNCPLPDTQPLAPEDVMERFLVQNFVAIPAPIFRKDIALHVGGLDESLWYSADWDLWLKLAAAGRTIYLAKVLAAYRIHNHAMTWWRPDAQIGERRRQLEQVLDRHTATLCSRRAIKPEIRRAARFSIGVNITLAEHAHRPGLGFFLLILGLLGLGPAGGYRFLRDSRIGERLSARVRAGMHRWHRSTGYLPIEISCR